MDELNNKFEEFNKNNKGGFITYIANEFMNEIVHNPIQLLLYVTERRDNERSPKRFKLQVLKYLRCYVLKLLST